MKPTKKKWIIKWDAGFGEMYDTVECATEDDALEAAEQSWRDEVESNADYEVVGAWTEELGEDYGC